MVGKCVGGECGWVVNVGGGECGWCMLNVGGGGGCGNLTTFNGDLCTTCYSIVCLRYGVSAKIKLVAVPPSIPECFKQ